MIDFMPNCNFLNWTDMSPAREANHQESCISITVIKVSDIGTGIETSL